jgi:hypothetical protein
MGIRPVPETLEKDTPCGYHSRTSGGKQRTRGERGPPSPPLCAFAYEFAMPLRTLLAAGFLVLCTSHAAHTAEPRPAYPPSPVIRTLQWAPAETIVRRAKDGDNWPITWADDDALYTTWGTEPVSRRR